MKKILRVCAFVLMASCAACQGDSTQAVQSAECGDGILERGELCDDANLETGDGCSALCQTEAGWTCAAEGCTCAAGFFGEACGACPECSNGGLCRDGQAGDGGCLCAAGFAGPTCELAEGRCQDAVCLNGAMCIEEDEGYRCECAAGFAGGHCETDIDECQALECQNGGRCVDEVGAGRCECAPGFTGQLCETEIDECEGQPCLNGGACVDEVARHRCECLEGFEGVDCGVDVDECEGQPCLNGGMCVDGVAGYRCECAPGFAGSDCEEDVDDCLAEPCVNGVCVDEVDGHRCECDDGFEGLSCDEDIDECLAEPCLNGGQCSDLVGSFECRCGPGFDGLNCEGVKPAIVDLVIGSEHACALLDTGDVKCWGGNRLGSLGSYEVAVGDEPGELGDALPPVDLGEGLSVIAVKASQTSAVPFTCALLSNGRMKCWGANFSGNLGYGDTQDRGASHQEMGQNLPFVDLGEGRVVVDFEVGAAHVCAILNDGGLRCWGDNGAGTLGLGHEDFVGDGPGEMGEDLEALDLGEGQRVVKVSMARSYPSHTSCALLQGGAVKCWGSNTRGELGQGDTENRGDQPGEMGEALPPVILGGAAVDVGVGYRFSCALLSDGGVKCWGDAAFGTLGQQDGRTIGDEPGEMESLQPIDLGTGLGAKAMSVGDFHVCVLIDDVADVLDDTVKCWGSNQSGQLGDGSTNRRGRSAATMGDDLPTVDFGGDGRALSVEAGGGTTCVVLADRTLRCWGANRQGQLGVPVLGEASQAFGDAPNEMGRLTPFPQLGRGRFVAQVSLGDHSCAVFTDGDLKCWGGNTAGELGLGFQGSAGAGRAQMGDALNTVDLGGQAVALLGAGRFSTCALMSDGHTKCWGSNQGGQLGVGDTLGRGARRSDMGGNLPVTDLGQDQLGDPLEPRQVVGGYSHFCALLEGGVKCWGDDSAIAGALGSGVRQALGDEPGEMGGALPFVDLGQGQRVEKIFGANHVCAVMDTGVMKCWGPNYSGQLGYGDTDARGDDPGEMGEALGYVDMGTNEQDEPHRVLQMVGNFVHSCALLDGGHVKCWGDNFAGQLGYGDTEARGDEPGEMGDALPYVDLGGPAIEITDQGYGTCALLEGGLVKCWGYGAGGGLGQGDAENIGDEEGEMGEALPSIDLGSGRTAIRLFPGADTSFHTCAQLDNLQVKCWGAGYAGQLGNGSRDFVGDTPGEMGDALPYLDLGR